MRLSSLVASCVVATVVAQDSCTDSVGLFIFVAVPACGLPVGTAAHVVISGSAPNATAWATAAYTACSSSCYASAVADLAVAVAGKRGPGCGVARSVLLNNTLACTGTTDALPNGACAVEGWTLLSAMASTNLPRVARIAADAALTAPMRDAMCSDPCFPRLLARVANISIAAAGAEQVYAAGHGTWNPGSDAAIQQFNDFLADLGTLTFAASAASIMDRTCAKDGGQYCALKLGLDFALPDFDPAFVTQPSLFLALLNHSNTALCSVCGQKNAMTQAAIAQRVLLVLGSVFGPSQEQFAAAIGIIIGMGRADIAGNLGFQFEAAAYAAALPSTVSLLCGLTPSGNTCLSLVSPSLDPTSLSSLAVCKDYIVSGASGACPAPCSSALASVQAPMGCCFRTVIAEALTFYPTAVALVLGPGTNMSGLAVVSAKCGSPFNTCSASSTGQLTFRLQNVNVTVFNSLSAPVRAAFVAGLTADVASALGVDASSVTVTSLSTSSGSLVAVITLTSTSDATLQATLATASASVTTGLLTFPQAGGVAANNGALMDPQAPMGADSTVAATPTPNTSGAGAATLPAATTLAAVAAAVVWMLVAARSCA